MIKKEDGESSGNEKPKKRMTPQQREEILVENFVGLQRAMTNLSIKFSALSENINKLLQIFQDAANNFSSDEREEKPSVDSNNDLVRKLDSLIDQNKIIAQGLVTMEEKLRSKTEPRFQMSNAMPQRPKPLPSR